MKIGIIGGGAIGLLFANYLSEQHQVTVYTRTEEQANLLNKEGLNFVINGVVKTKNIQASKSTDLIDSEDLLLITVKQYHLADIYEAIASFMKPIVFLQNGYGHIDFVGSLPSPSLFVGVVEHGALRHSPNTVEHTGIGVTKLAVFSGDWGIIHRIIEESTPMFSYEQNEDYKQLLLAKLMVNAVINPLTAILGVPNGELIVNPFYVQLMEKYFDEIANIIQLQNKVATLKRIKEICRMTSNNRSSMLKDIENGRETEVDAILGPILIKAKQLNYDDSMTEYLYIMIKGKELQKG